MVSKGNKSQTKILVRYKLGGGRKMTPNGEKVEMLKKEIELVMERNRNETYLKSLLTRALVLEKLHNK
jgi:hypothetical protein